MSNTRMSSTWEALAGATSESSALRIIRAHIPLAPSSGMRADMRGMSVACAVKGWHRASALLDTRAQWTDTPNMLAPSAMATCSLAYKSTCTSPHGTEPQHVFGFRGMPRQALLGDDGRPVMQESWVLRDVGDIVASDDPSAPVKVHVRIWNRQNTCKACRALNRRLTPLQRLTQERY